MQNRPQAPPSRLRHRIRGVKSTRTDTFDFETSPSTYTSWRRIFFEEGDSSGARMADADGDGYPNFFEYVFDGDPLEADTLRPPESTLALGEGIFSVEYRRLRDTGLEWHSEVSENLVQWRAWQDHDLTIEEEVEDNGDGTETVRLLITNSGDALFWRLVVFDGG